MPYLPIPDRDIEIYYEDHGGGEPVVLIGGVTSTIATWCCQIGPLSEQFRVITPDNRGSGQTRMLDDDGVRTPSRFAGDIAALIDGLGIDRVHLVGMSLGGTIVQAFAAEHEHRLRSLTLFCTWPGLGHIVPLDLDKIELGSRSSLPGATREDVEASARVAMHPDAERDNRPAWELYLATKEEQAHAAKELGLRAAGQGTLSVWDALGRLQVSTLVMTGDGDRLVPAQNSAILAQRISGARLVTVARGGHVFQLEQPEFANRTLAEFFRSC